MKIRKLYRIESSHIVRNCVSKRCSESFHGHSGIIEVFLKSKGLDNADMVIDFGALKNNIGSFIDMFDHAVHLWKKDDPEVIDFYKKHNQRFIILPCNPTAENYCLLFKDCINELLSNVRFNNGENDVYCSGVRYHETATGYAESDESDIKIFSLTDIEFSCNCFDEASRFIHSHLMELIE